MLRAGHGILLCALGLLMVGVVMVHSASMVVRPLAEGVDPQVAAAVSGVTVESLLFSRTTLYLALAVGAMALASRLPLRRLADRTQRAAFLPPAGDLGLLILGSVGLLAVLATVYIPGIGREAKGATRWVNLHLPGLESVQPSEIAKWGLVLLVAVFAARLATRTDNHMRRFFSGLLPACLCIGAVAGFVVLEDLGTGVLMVAACAVVLLAAGARIWHFLLFTPPAILAFIVAVVTTPYRVQRITSFLDPYADPQGAGYHMIQSLTTVAGGGIFGRGLGHGLQKFGYLPEDTTDFLYAVICEELGLFGALLVLFLYATLAWCGTTIARRETNPALKLAALGVTATITLQALINLFVVVGLAPTKGIALPLISSGGTGWILTGFALGLVVAIDRTQPAAVLDDFAIERDPTDHADADRAEIVIRPGITLPGTPARAPAASGTGVPPALARS
ncbi:MAG: putative lipid II flippase FtsW [Phycisphaerales bacterium]|nr:cell division protein FtsW [Planctomycetota bacterium]MCH8509863.1 putative lipid II flippase FtsW [Phycisphaerales bacterium]